MLSVLGRHLCLDSWARWGHDPLIITSQPFVPSSMLNRTTLWHSRRTAMPPRGLYRQDSACTIVPRCTVRDPSRPSTPRCSVGSQIAHAQQTGFHESFCGQSPYQKIVQLTYRWHSSHLCHCHSPPSLGAVSKTRVSVNIFRFGLQSTAPRVGLRRTEHTEFTPCSTNPSARCTCSIVD